MANSEVESANEYSTPRFALEQENIEEIELLFGPSGQEIRANRGDRAYVTENVSQISRSGKSESK